MIGLSSWCSCLAATPGPVIWARHGLARAVYWKRGYLVSVCFRNKPAPSHYTRPSGQGSYDELQIAFYPYACP